MDQFDSFVAICSKRLQNNPNDVVAIAALSFDSESKPESPEKVELQKRFELADKELSAS